MSNDLTNVIIAQLTELHKKKDAISIEDIKEILEKVAGAIGNGTSLLDRFLRDEIIKISNHIEATKNEIIALAPANSENGHIGTAAIQLDAVMKATEEAAHGIMDAVDEIQNIVSASNLDKEVQNKITDATTRIYEACNFQDLTGQRINKVMKALEFTEAKINRLVKLFASDGTVNVEELTKATTEREDAHLLNGPQLPSVAPSQSDIDAMFG